MATKRPEISTKTLKTLYLVDHMTLREIGARVGMSHAGVMRRLHRAGVSAREGEYVKISCGYCGCEIERVRSRARRAAQSYCNSECYYASMDGERYKPWRQGQRIARAIVAQYFELEPEHVVDHHDGDNRNNDKANLRVYASQADHMAMHRGHKVEPLWDGALLS